MAEQEPSDHLPASAPLLLYLGAFFVSAIGRARCNGPWELPFLRNPVRIIKRRIPHSSHERPLKDTGRMHRSLLVNAAGSAGHAGCLRRNCTDSYVENRIHRSLVLEMAVTTLPTSSETKAQSKQRWLVPPRRLPRRRPPRPRPRPTSPRSLCLAT